MTCHIPTWPVASDKIALGGKSWIRAVESLIKLTSAYPMAVLLGRAGMGKSQVALEVCKRTNCIYIDFTEMGERSMANIAAVVAWRLLSRHGGREAKSRIVEAYRKFGYEGLLSLAKGGPHLDSKSRIGVGRHESGCSHRRAVALRRGPQVL